MANKVLDYKKFIQNSLIPSVNKEIRSLRGLTVLAAVLSAVLPTVLSPDLRALSILLPVLLTLLVWRCHGARTAFFLSALPGLASLAGLLFQLNFRQTDPLSALLHSRMTAAVEAEITVSDPSLDNDGGRSEAYRRILCRVTAVRFSPSDSWIRVNAKVIGSFAPEIRGLAYGNRWLVKGILQRPEPPLLPESFDYQDYLNRRGIHFILQVRELSRNGEEISFTRFLIGIRNRLLSALNSGLKNPQEQALAAGMLFGCRGEITGETRNIFVQSGAIHILTVSGLHIGMFAGAVFLLLLSVPFRLRMVLTPLLTLLYALSTGMQMPALRAVVMLFCWCIPRALLLRGSALNSVFLAGSLLLIWNPFQLKDAGFQYSFLCVTTLIASTLQVNSWLQLMVEKQHWLPDAVVGKWRRLLTRRLIGAAACAAGCLNAWLCSFILTAFHQGLAVSFAMVTNLLIIPVVYLIFLIFTAGALPCLLFPPLGKVLALLLELPLAWIGSTCRFFAELSDGRIPVPPLWSVYFGIAALWTLFACPGKKLRVAAICGLSALFFFWCSGIFQDRSGELLLFYGGRQKVPALVFSLPEDDFSIAANVADYRNAAAAADYLRRRGHTGLTVLISSGTSGGFTFGAQYLPVWLKTGHYLAEQPSSRAKTAHQAAHRVERQGGILHWQRGKHLRWSSGGKKIETFAENGRFSFDISKNENKLHILAVPDVNAGTEVRLLIPGQPPRKVTLPRERAPGIIRMKLNW
ncbi:MAG: ComEC family competence protein [Lentisphaerae bacterium]|nr:ComEC family competence protein [Lentisphaerota bacterium]